jgi:hypothetical protein
MDKLPLLVLTSIRRPLVERGSSREGAVWHLHGQSTLTPDNCVIPIADLRDDELLIGGA